MTHSLPATPQSHFTPILKPAESSSVVEGSSSGGDATTPTSTATPSPRSSLTPRALGLLLQLAKSDSTAQFLSLKNRKATFALELPFAVLSAIVFIVGIGAALGVLLGLEQTDVQDMKNMLQVQATQHITRLQDETQRLLGYTWTVNSLFAAMGTGVTLTQYTKFCEQNRLKQSYILDMTWLPFVANSQRDAFVQNIRNTLGAETNKTYYSNFDLFGLKADGTKVISRHADASQPYFPILYMYPPEPSSFFGPGYDMSWDPARNASIFSAFQRRDVFLTPRLSFTKATGHDSNWYGLMLLAPVVYNASNDWIGMSRAKVRLDMFIGATIQESDSYYITAYDVSSDLSKPTYLHTSAPHSMFTSPGFTDLIDDDAGQTRLYDWLQKQSISANKAYTGQQLLLQMDLPFVFNGRNYTLWFTRYPDTQVSQYGALLARRWVAFAVILVATIAASIFLLLGVGCVRYARITIGALSQKLNQLKRTKDRMHDLIDTLSLEEQRSRLTMSLLPVGVLLVDSQTGHVDFANEVFLRFSNYNDKELATGEVLFSRIFPQLSLEEIKETVSTKKRNVQKSTVIRSAFGVEEQCAVSIQFVVKRSRNEALRHIKRRRDAALELELQNAQFTADCVIVVDVRTADTSTADSTDSFSENNSSSLIGDSARNTSSNNPAKLFEQMWAASQEEQQGNGTSTSPAQQMLRAFIEFCQREQSVEGIQFISAVKEFKRIEDTFLRVEKQHIIFNQFLNGQASANELNIPVKSLGNEIDRIKRFLGQRDIFDVIVEQVANDIRQDLFMRFLEERQRHRQSLRMEAAAAATQAVATSAPGTAAASLSIDAVNMV